MLFGLYRVNFPLCRVHQLFWRSPKRLPFTGSFLRLYLPLSGCLGCRARSALSSQLYYFCSLPCHVLSHGSGLAACILNDCSRDSKPRALIYGAGEAGRELAAALSHSHVTNVVGFLDDDAKLHGSQIRGLPVYDPVNAALIIARKRVSEIMLALPRISRRRRSEILQLLRRYNVTVRTLPSYSDLAEGRVTVNDIRELSISDVLGRDTVAPDPALMRRDIAGKTVVVTGAGGSIGSELCRQIFEQRRQKNWCCLIIVNMRSMRYCMS